MGTVEVGSFRAGTGQGYTRRAFPSASMAAPFALASATRPGLTPAENRKASSILLVWLRGGPSRLDLFDPKPKAPLEYRSPFSTIATRAPATDTPSSCRSWRSVHTSSH